MIIIKIVVTIIIITVIIIIIIIIIIIVIRKSPCKSLINFNILRILRWSPLFSLIGGIDATTTRGNSSNCKVSNRSFIRLIKLLWNAVSGKDRSVTSQTLLRKRQLLSCKIYRFVILPPPWGLDRLLASDESVIWWGGKADRAFKLIQ